MALGDERRASGAANEAARRAIGSNNEASRRAGGSAMEATRRGTTIKDALNALETPRRQSGRLRELERKGTRPTTAGVGNWNPANQPSDGTAGIASPITEPDFAVREFWPTGLASSDGLFFLPAVKKVIAQDANGAEVIFEYAQPVPA